MIQTMIKIFGILFIVTVLWYPLFFLLAFITNYIFGAPFELVGDSLGLGLAEATPILSFGFLMVLLVLIIVDTIKHKKQQK